MTRKPSPDGVRVWICGVCGHHGQWGPGWAIHGSIRDEENGKPVLIACSVQCRIAHTARGEGEKRPARDSMYYSLPPKDGGGELLPVAASQFHYHARLPRTVGPDGGAA